MAATGKFREVNAGEAALYALLGFMVVFVGILFLILVVWLVGLLMAKIEKAGEKKTVKPVETPKAEEKQAAPTALDGVDEETIAVITAAIMAYYQQDNPKCDFKVKRIKRI